MEKIRNVCEWYSAGMGESSGSKTYRISGKQRQVPRPLDSGTAAPGMTLHFGGNVVDETMPPFGSVATWPGRPVAAMMT